MIYLKLSKLKYNKNILKLSKIKFKIKINE